MPTDTKKLPLGGPAWLRAIADDQDEMLHAIGAIDRDGEREQKREILGLRDAASRMERAELKVETLALALGALNRRVHTGYDFNADPDNITALVGDALKIAPDTREDRPARRAMR